MRMIALAVASMPSAAILTVKLALMLYATNEPQPGLPWESPYNRMADAWTWPTVVVAMLIPYLIFLAIYLMVTVKISNKGAGTSPTSLS